MTRRLVACHFGVDERDTWRRMARVLEASARQHCAGWTIDVVPMQAPYRRHVSESVQGLANAQKLEFWAQAVLDAADGDELLLIDADMLIVQSLDALWRQPFDLAYTCRPYGSRYPFNAGVVGVRASRRARGFMVDWATMNRLMLEQHREHRPWQQKYGGWNQASLGRLLEQPRADSFDLALLPCAIWNCEDLTWQTFSPSKTRIVHLKGQLRAAALGALEDAEPWLRPLAQYWRDREAAVMAGGPTT